MAAVLSMGAPPLWLLSSLLFVLGMAGWAPAGRSRLATLAACGLSGLWMLLSLMLTAAYFSQGQGFDDAFFYHFNLPAIVTGFEIYPAQSYGSMLLLGFAVLWPLLLKSGRAAAGMAGLAALVVATLISTPLHSYIAYRSAPDAPEASGLAEFRAAEVGAVSGLSLAAPGSNKNIVLIYLEGLEQAYFDRQLVGNLLPELSSLRERSARFTNLRQVRGTSWTIAGMVASQCGFPLLTSNDRANNSTMASTDRPFANSRCLGDILKQAGYRNVFYGGADHRFAGKGNFLRTHGFDEVYGAEELQPMLPDDAPLNQWGLYDEQLFALALERIKSLEAGEAPWLVTVLSVDTHFPRGHPSPGCAPYSATTDEISQAIYCTDQVVSDFVAEVQAVTDPENTVIAIFSDHLSFRNTLQDKLASLDERRLLFMLLDQHLGPGEFDVPGTHFDVAPTLLGVAGVADAEQIASGVSLVSDRPAERPAVDEVAAATPGVLAGSPSVLETGILFNASDLSMSFGDMKLVPHRQGFPFDGGMFFAVIDATGHISDTVYENDTDQLLERHMGRFVVGVSLIPDMPQAVVFVGTISEDPATINQALLQQNLFIAPEQVAGWLGLNAEVQR